MKNLIQFQKASSTHQETIFSWLASPHVREFWDNSPEHKTDIKLFISGRKQPSNYFDGSCPELWRQNLSLQGTTISIDFCIGTLNYLGKGLAAPTLEAFVKFFNETVDPKADTFFIDPNKDNLRATHVYEKAGFKLIGSFAAEQGFFIGKESFLMIKKL